MTYPWPGSPRQVNTDKLLLIKNEIDYRLVDLLIRPSVSNEGSADLRIDEIWSAARKMSNQLMVNSQGKALRMETGEGPGGGSITYRLVCTLSPA